MAAPVVVAKGDDNFALRIRDVAKEHRSNRYRKVLVLARALDGAVKVGAAIPEPLYRAVAALIAWAYEVKAEPARAPNFICPTMLFLRNSALKPSLKIRAYHNRHKAFGALF
jgi:flagellar biosynthetic protein FlhB